MSIVNRGGEKKIKLYKYSCINLKSVVAPQYNPIIDKYMSEYIHWFIYKTFKVG